MVKHLGLVLAATGVLAAAPAGAAQLKQVGTIAVPGEPLATFDIGVVDQEAQRYYLADRTNKSLDIFDAKTDAFLGRVPSFVGQKESNDVSGPDGVVLVGGEAWVGDGDRAPSGSSTSRPTRSSPRFPRAARRGSTRWPTTRSTTSSRASTTPTTRRSSPWSRPARTARSWPRSSTGTRPTAPSSRSTWPRPG